MLRESRIAWCPRSENHRPRSSAPNHGIEAPRVCFELRWCAQRFGTLCLENHEVPSVVVDPLRGFARSPVLLQGHSAPTGEFNVQARECLLRERDLLQHPRHLIEVAQAIANDQDISCRRRALRRVGYRAMRAMLLNAGCLLKKQ